MFVEKDYLVNKNHIPMRIYDAGSNCEPFSHHTYDIIMHDCWKADPRDRP